MARELAPVVARAGYFPCPRCTATSLLGNDRPAPGPILQPTEPGIADASLKKSAEDEVHMHQQPPNHRSMDLSLAKVAMSTKKRPKMLRRTRAGASNVANAAPRIKKAAHGASVQP